MEPHEDNELRENAAILVLLIVAAIAVVFAIAELVK